MRLDILSEGAVSGRMTSPHFCVLPAAALEITSPHLCVMPTAALEMYREPLFNIAVTEAAFIVTAELPGVPKENVEVTVTGKTVEIGGTRREVKERLPYTHCETVSKTFFRGIDLPDEIDPEAAKSEFADGVLELVLPKKKATRKGTVKLK